MKIRNGFVSNSSSSSFTCDLCGCTEAGWDLCLSDAEMIECNEGHVFCEQHIDADLIEKLQDDDDEWRYCLDIKYCPICTLKEVSSEKLLKYIIKKYNLNKSDIENEIREKFSNYIALEQYIKGETNENCKK